MELAKSWGVTFVQIIEPRATGRYSNRNVELTDEMIQVLEETYLDYNNTNKYKAYPIINYLGYHQRRVGCYGAGDRFFYIDTDGFAHICPYCMEKVADIRDHTAKEIIKLLSMKTCHSFENANIDYNLSKLIKSNVKLVPTN